ncbi:S10 family peptidase [Sphingomonas bacterium]|uniref:S10 family peptidase n=1 Tax=Sphingomonas bacterium TaxID=1895847 RepID=UPI0020C73C72|nr:peptidase S10 [Sphingomonas bacterium]
MRVRTSNGWLAAALWLAASTSAVAQDMTDKPADAAAGAPRTGSADQRHQDRVAQQVADEWAVTPAKETTTATQHSVEVGGRTLRYHAVAGTVTIRNDDAKPVASVFYVAYTLDGASPATRPVTFFYNGGPGSSSVWLHMGSFAPVRVKTANPEFIRPAPYGFGPNPDTLLDKTDMVFIDMVGTGYSRPLGDARGKDFWGVDQDADAFAKAIMRWTDVNSRWTSPKFLFGESYGTTRSAAVAYQLQDRGMALNGVVLLSSILNYGIEQAGYDQSYVSYLPSYAATAWYHQRLTNRPADLPAYLAEVRAFAAGPYSQALAKGQDITPEETDTIAAKVAGYTGLSATFVKRANLRVDLNRFQKELLRDQRRTIGRFDSRYTGIDADAAGESPDFDASDSAISSAFVSTFSDYVKRDLNYKTEVPYRVEAYGLKDFDWDWKHRSPGNRWPQNNPDVAVDLAAAIRTNPYLKVLSLNGWYDMATPFFATEYDIAHMLLDAPLKQNVSFRYYPSGHMIYLNPEALHQLHGDLAEFYDTTVASAAQGKPSLKARP